MPKGHDSKSFISKPSIATSNLVGEDENVYIFNEEDVIDISDIGNGEHLDEKIADCAKITKIAEESGVNDINREKTIVREINDHIDDNVIDEEASQSLKLQLEESFRRQEIESIAQENLSLKNKLFVYPPEVLPGQDIEVFFNRNFSTLCNEPNVFIKGAFNDWRWKLFTKRLNKTQLPNGDWWSCQLHVPREAYKVDFVFFNGENVYDNNDTKDFSIPVDCGIDALGFEDFLLEEKRKEVERLAKEQAEKEEQEKKKRKMEAEKTARDEDKSLAREEVKREREAIHNLTKNAVKCIDNLWYTEPSEFQWKDWVKLYYNRKSGPLAQLQEVWLHGGYNNWQHNLSYVQRLGQIDSKDGDWWCANVVVPDQAVVLDWVFADGPPGNASVYDNNNGKDFHAIVAKVIPDEQTWIWEEQRIYANLREKRRLREEAKGAKKVTVNYAYTVNLSHLEYGFLLYEFDLLEKTAIIKAETKKKTLERFLLSQKNIVFTQPLHVQAGGTVTVFYNPCNTNLNGKPEIWFQYSFNRWTHRSGLLPPQKMVSAKNGTYVKAFGESLIVVKVPLDAYMIDFVFSDKEEGGIFDNNDGMDYHMPVLGGTVKETPMHIVHIAVEMAPIAKVGGLGDVVTSLSRAVQDLNHNVDIILPKYDCLNLSNVKDFRFHKHYFWGRNEIKVWNGKVEGLSVYFLEPQNE
ncbi:unnamed protein product [Sphenostylis stenocarpa]|uniref:starch synthase n=1 Tax=Sphenostylis stenocarpa TaxID=92480 RepID=A0AA86SIV1_9FABA|nr:unnamed protein product [Sphenostylis stenocarpa]